MIFLNKNNVFYKFFLNFFCIADKFPFTGDHRDFKNTGRENLGRSCCCCRCQRPRARLAVRPVNGCRIAG